MWQQTSWRLVCISHQPSCAHAQQDTFSCCHSRLPSHLLHPHFPNADAVLGTAPLVHGEVSKGLSYRSLALLQPCAITVHLSAEPLQPAAAGTGGSLGEQPQQAAAAALQLMAAPEAEQQQQLGAAAYGRFPAFGAALGQPLCVTLSVTNHGRTVIGGGKSPRSSLDGGSRSGGSATAAAGAGAADALELQLDAAVACQPVRGSEQEEAAAAASHELSAVWAGQLWTGLRLTVPPGQTISQRLGLCLLAPGLYQISLQHWQCRTAAQAAAAAAQAAGASSGQQQQEQQLKKKKSSPPGPLQNTMVAVEPCFVLAVAGQQ